MPEKVKEQTYISKILNLTLINKSSYSKEVGGKFIVVQGSKVEFNDGVFITSDPSEIEFLDNHGNCGNVFIKVKSKDVEKAKEDKFKDLETKEKEIADKEKEVKRREKALEEGSELPGKKGKGKGNKKDKEKPAF